MRASPYRPPISDGYGHHGFYGAVRYRPQHEAVFDATQPPAELGRYVELHCHSCFSLREGASRPEELVVIAKSLGYQALALTDHDSLAGAMIFAQKARETGLKAIIG